MRSAGDGVMRALLAYSNKVLGFNSTLLIPCFARTATSISKAKVSVNKDPTLADEAFKLQISG